MNQKCYSAHHIEQEVLLIDGTSMIVLAVDKIFINMKHSQDQFWKPFNGKTITVLYLFNAIE